MADGLPLSSIKQNTTRALTKAVATQLINHTSVQQIPQDRTAHQLASSSSSSSVVAGEERARPAGEERRKAEKLCGERKTMEVAAAAATSYVADDVDNLKATELRLGLPGTEEKKPAAAALLPTPPSTPRGKKRDVSCPEEAAASQKRDCAPPAAKAQVVGWPPVRSYRKSCFQQQASSAAAAAKSKPPAAAPAEEAAAPAGGLFVKVSMDGAPYLRKIDLKVYKGYRELREALEAMFLCFSGAGAESPAAVNPSDFAVTYEDKDGDLMLVGDVPFDMFISTCKRLRIMKGSEARGLGSVKSN